MRSIATVSGLALLCASAAVAQAGDLPAKKAGPVEPDYVRECTIGKFKGILIPGSEVCFQPWARVRSEVYYNERFARNQDVTRFRIRGYLGAEVLQPTEYGGLTGRIRFYVQQTTGAPAAGSTDSDAAYLDVAFFSFAGFTVGRFNASYFDFPLGLSYVGGNSGRGSDLTGAAAPPLVAYTLPMGDFTGTLSFEDGSYRRSGIGAVNGAGVPQNGANAAGMGGQIVPDVVGKLDWAQSWGSVSASGALHQVRSGLEGVDAVYGFAGQLGTKINLPTPIKGGFLSLVAAYADGANSYTGTATNSSLAQSFRAGTLGPASAPVNFNTYDAYLVGDSLKTTKSWVVTGGASIPLTEQVTQSLFASYADVNQYGTTRDGAIWQLGSRVTWAPVKKLEIGAEVIYAKWAEVPKALKPLVPGNSDDSWSGRIRLQRDF